MISRLKAVAMVQSMILKLKPAVRVGSMILILKAAVMATCVILPTFAQKINAALNGVHQNSVGESVVPRLPFV